MSSTKISSKKIKSYCSDKMKIGPKDNCKKVKTITELCSNLEIPFLSNFDYKLHQSGKNKGKIASLKITRPFKYTISGNYIMAVELIKKYNLSYGGMGERFDSFFGYRWTSYAMPNKNGQYSISSFSEYGQQCVNFIVNDYDVHLVVSSNNENALYRMNVLRNARINPNDLVVLDIETTGLSPLRNDILEIGLYDIETGSCYSRYLPLVKKQTIPEEITLINHITDSMVKKAKPMKQSELNKLFKDFNLDKKKLLIWTGANLFDAQWIGTWFVENDYKGLDKLTFVNGKDLADANKDKLNINDLSKDTLARYYGIPLNNSHTALGDCKIEAEIYKKLYSRNFKLGELYETGRNLYNSIYSLETLGDRKKENIDKAKELYFEFIKYCTTINGKVAKDYDCYPRTRGAEWIDIHHIDEIELDNIAVRTQEAMKEKNYKLLDLLKQYNLSNRLVYVDKIQHFILHYLIDFIRGSGGGPHFLFGDIFRMEHKLISEAKEKLVYQKLKSYYEWIDYHVVLSLYNRILVRNNFKVKDVFDFWKISKDIYKTVPSIDKPLYIPK